MYQNSIGATELGVALTEQELEKVVGGDGNLWAEIGFGLGYIAGRVVRAVSNL